MAVGVVYLNDVRMARVNKCASYRLKILIIQDFWARKLVWHVLKIKFEFSVLLSWKTSFLVVCCRYVHFHVFHSFNRSFTYKCSSHTWSVFTWFTVCCLIAIVAHFSTSWLAGWLDAWCVCVCALLSVATTNLFRVFRFSFYYKICKIISVLMVTM